MSIKYDDAKKGIVSTIKFYFKNRISAENWYEDNDSEIEYIAGCIEDMINERVKEEIEKLKETLLK